MAILFPYMVILLTNHFSTIEIQ